MEGGSSPEPSSIRPTLSSQPRQPLVTDSCRNGQLKVTSVGGGEGAGSVYMLFEFVNVSRSACNLSGYPRVVPVDRQGVQVAPGSPVTGPASSSFYNGQPPLTIDLKPGEAASSAIQGIAHPLSGQGLSCPASYPFFLVTPPNQTRSVKVPAKPPPGDPLPSAFPGCAPVAINSIVPGASGQLPQPPLPRASTGTPPSIPTTTLPESATDTSVGCAVIDSESTTTRVSRSTQGSACTPWGRGARGYREAHQSRPPGNYTREHVTAEDGQRPFWSGRQLPPC